MNLIFLILLGVTMLAVLRKVFSIIQLQSTKHLTATQIRQFSRGNMDKMSQEYSEFITHIGGCDLCKEKLDDYIDGKPIEEVFIEE